MKHASDSCSVGIGEETGSLPEPGASVDVTVESIAYRGAGIARTGGWVVFIPGTAEGETVRIKIVRRRRNYLEADVLEILSRSPHRIDPPVHDLPENPPGVLHGCVYGHLAYPEECRLKREQLVSFLTRAGLCPEDAIGPMIPSPESLNYRNKIVLHVGATPDGLVLGYVAGDNRTIIDLRRCALAVAPLNDLLRRIRGAADFESKLGLHRQLTLRYTEADGAVAWWDKPDPHEAFLSESTPLGDLSVPKGAFYQVNPPVAEALVAQIREWIRVLSPDVLLDMYCGVGLFALVAAREGVPTVWGCDSNRQAIKAARLNAQKLGLPVRFDKMDVGVALKGPMSDGLRDRNACLVVDPPRRGLSQSVLNAVVPKKPAALIYISCAPDTLVRDLKRLHEAGYRIQEAKPFDMFPRTASFETLVLLRIRPDA